MSLHNKYNLEFLKHNILTREFYLQDVFAVLRGCLGKILTTNVDNQLTAGRIVEAEAYVGSIDKASHAYPNRHTPRTKVHYEIGGHAYVFIIHTHPQFNIVCEEAGIANVILIRAVEPLAGIETMWERRPTAKSEIELVNGPGKMCHSLGITKYLYGEDLTTGSLIWLSDDGFKVVDEDIVKTSRVGIEYAEEFKDVPWRYYIKDNPYVSKKLRQ